MEGFYWCLVFENYHEDNYIEYFDTMDNAVAAFEGICEACKNHLEFVKDEDSCHWFDPMWNEDSTHVFLLQRPMPSVNNSAISLFFDKDYERVGYRR